MRTVFQAGGEERPVQRGPVETDTIIFNGNFLGNLRTLQNLRANPGSRPAARSFRATPTTCRSAR
jgi:hypothetical protein